MGLPQGMGIAMPIAAAPLDMDGNDPFNEMHASPVFLGEEIKEPIPKQDPNEVKGYKPLPPQPNLPHPRRSEPIISNANDSMNGGWQMPQNQMNESIKEYHFKKPEDVGQIFDLPNAPVAPAAPIAPVAPAALIAPVPAVA